MIFDKLSARSWRVVIVATVALIVVGGVIVINLHEPKAAPANSTTLSSNQSLAINALGKLAVKGAASHTGYARAQFGNGWATVGSCDMREQILGRDLAQVKFRSATDCTIVSGMLNDPYTGKIMHFTRGPGTSSAIQIDHVVALSDAWQTGAKNLSLETREQLYNDPLELLAVDGPANNAKGSSDASAWLPPNKPYDCRYIARQIAVKLKYHLWLTPPEHTAIQQTLKSCPDQALPTVNNYNVDYE
jgi:hypothetical protein